MSTFYLLNTTLVGTVKYFPGDTIDSVSSPKSAIEAAGGICWPSTDATVETAALFCQSQRKNRGVREEELQPFMFAAVSASLTATDTANAATAAAATAAATAASVAAAAAAMPVFRARGVSITNVADLAAFVVSNNGVTYVANDVILLANQTTAAECGLYKVGTVAGTAPLTRIAALPAAAAYVNGTVVEVSEGTLYAGSSWKAMCTGAKVVGTHDPLFYPRTSKGILTLASGTYTLGSTEGFYLFSAACPIECTMNTPGGTLTLTTGGYGANTLGRTAGKSGAGAAIVIARVAAGTIDTANNSTVDYCATNW